MNDDTIAAIATAVSSSGIGIVRISGDSAFLVIDRIFKGKKNKKISSQKSHTIHYGYIVDDEEMIDEVLVSIMKGPHSYTAEDTIEINCHGGVLVVKRVLETVLKHGARIAEPGEFTKRAFLNGRIDLSQAEAVIDVIQSKNEYALKSSISQLKGSVLEVIKKCREMLIYQIAYIESALDDPEHISLDGYSDDLTLVVEEQIKKLEKLEKSSKDGRIMKEGVKTVIVGKPNAGKSSILNVLLGEDRAIVTDVAGTTRDVLEESMNLGSVTLNMVDTAGIRSTEDVVERIGVQKAKEYADLADLIIYVVDGSRNLDENDEEIMDLILDKKVLVLLNKSDLRQVISEETMKERLPCEVLSVSAREKYGIDELVQKIETMFYSGKLEFNDEVYLSNARQVQAVKEALESLKMVKKSIEDGMPEDFYSIDLMSSYEALGRITGESIGEDLVNEIFSKFCMGK
ncbi:MAG TPA: tRNA uridine-5-carboxymethylaminomethyl(34) synthesis GTPase MnmE [Candidatus Merdenecus merdavium]|nr:tRNA uridine-5-carboxymethylaminomethyl(34) synthesis GTPase MnmE [Candidatus Merdenecus merdavium]